jgi:hypothetical protein
MIKMAGNDEAGGEVFVASKQKAKNGLGQNGFQGASSDLPGQHTVMDRDFGLAKDPSADAGDWQTRKVSAEPYPPAHGMKAAPAPAVIGKSNFHRAVQRTSNKSFQRR